MPFNSFSFLIDLDAHLFFHFASIEEIPDEYTPVMTMPIGGGLSDFPNLVAIFPMVVGVFLLFVCPIL